MERQQGANNIANLPNSASNNNARKLFNDRLSAKCAVLVKYLNKLASLATPSLVPEIFCVVRSPAGNYLVDFCTGDSFGRPAISQTLRQTIRSIAAADDSGFWSFEMKEMLLQGCKDSDAAFATALIDVARTSDIITSRQAELMLDILREDKPNSRGKCQIMQRK